MFSSDRDTLRQQMAEAWRKHKAGQVLEPHEAQVADVLQIHPEYHALVEDPDLVNREFSVEDGQINPLLHVSLHLAVRDQARVDRPPGCRQLFEQLAHALGDAHEAEHVMVERLGEYMWQAQRAGAPPPLASYLDALRGDLGRIRGRGPKDVK